MKPRDASRRPARARARQQRAHNLPAPLTRLIGRASELAAVCRALLEPHVRLLTLVGPPGVGKTRLALDAAAQLLGEFAHGAFWVPLAPLRDPDLVASAIARALGVRELGGRPLQETLQAALRCRQLLLLLDNLEHLPAAAPLVADLLAACPGLKVLATGRAPLHVYGEQELPLLPLALPDLQQPVDPEALAEVPAVALLLERARAVRPDFALTAQNAAAVAELCVRLDGLPLAIELAAARMKTLSPQAILSRLESRLDLLSDGALGRPDRHRTLRPAIAWSHDLLSADEQRLLRRLAVFRGGCTLAAAEAVGGAMDSERPTADDQDASLPSPVVGRHPSVLEGLASLVDRSLVRQAEQGGGEPRFWMLETVREYALERLEASGEAEATRRRHAEFFLRLAEAAEPGLVGSEPLGLVLDRLEREHDNLRAALAWAQAETDELRAGASRAEIGLRTAGALGWFWLNRGYAGEGRRWLEAALGRSEPAGPTAARGRALFALGGLTLQQADFRAMRAASEEGLRVARALGDRQAIGRALNRLGHAWRCLGDHEAALALHQESLAILRDLGDAFGLAWVLQQLGVLAALQGELAPAIAFYEESAALFRSMGNRFGLSRTLGALATASFRSGDPGRATALIREALVALRELGDAWWTASCLLRLAEVASGVGEYARAARLLGAAEGLMEAIGAGLNSAERSIRDAARDAARPALGEQAFEAEWAQGRTMTPERAIEYALTGEEAGPGAEHGRAAPTAEQASPLTAREREIAVLIARGLSNRQIAEELVLSVRTVERHIENLYAKLGVSGRVARAAVATFALRHGLA